MKPNPTDIVTQRLDRIEAVLASLVAQKTAKDWYTPAEVAQLLRKNTFTVREWCRLSRIRAEKRACGRGKSQEWMISHEELLRYQNHGLLPVPRTSTKL